MSKRKGDLLSLLSKIGLFLIVVGLIAYILEFSSQGRYLEAILCATVGIGIFLLFALGLLGEILGNIRDLNAVLRGREKEDTEHPA